MIVKSVLTGRLLRERDIHAKFQESSRSSSFGDIVVSQGVVFLLYIMFISEIKASYSQEICCLNMPRKKNSACELII